MFVRSTLAAVTCLTLVLALQGCSSSNEGGSSGADDASPDTLGELPPLPDDTLDPDVPGDTTQPDVTPSDVQPSDPDTLPPEDVSPPDSVDPPDVGPGDTSDVDDVAPDADVTPPTGAPLGGACQTDGDCAEGRCMTLQAGDQVFSFCTRPCTRAADCDVVELWRCVEEEGERLCSPRNPGARCEPNALLCEDDDAVARCNAVGTALLEPSPCASDERCVPDPARCIPEDATPCSPDTFLGCTDAGRELRCTEGGYVFDEGQVCPPEQTCHEPSGGCAMPRCAAGAAFCEGMDRRRCAEDGFSSTLLETCADRCRAGLCEVRVCSPGQRFCQANELWSCAPDGFSSDRLLVCPIRCAEGACREEICQPDSVFCEGAERRLCDGDGLGSSLIERCPGRCRDATCVLPTCSEGSLFCADAELRRCTDAGYASALVERCGYLCRDQACWERVCEPNALACEGDNVVRCRADGTEEQPWQTCADTCRGGACVPYVCQPSSRFCEGRELRRCADDGLSFTPLVTCPEGCRQGACEAFACTPNAVSCQDGNVVRCAADGFSSAVVERCDAGCEAGACVRTCADPTGRSDVGCSFLGVWVDRFEQSGSQSVAWHVVNEESRSFSVALRSVDGVLVERQTLRPGEPAIFQASLTAPTAATRRARSAWRIEAEGRISVVQFSAPTSDGSVSADGTRLLPNDLLGERYTLLTNARFQGTSVSFFPIVVIANPGTSALSVTVRSPVAIEGGTSIPRIPAGGTGNYNLAAGDVLYLMASPPSGADPASGLPNGLTIEASGRVAAFSTHPCGQVPLSVGYCDHMSAQLLPHHGSTFAVVPHVQRGSEPSILRVQALQDGTTLQTNPPRADLNGRRLNAGEVIEVEYLSAFDLSGSGPLQVHQLTVGSRFQRNEEFAIPRTCPAGCFGFLNCTEGVGEPSVVPVLPREQWAAAGEAVLSYPTGYRQRVVTIVAASGATVTLNDEPVSLRPSTGTERWSFAHVVLNSGVTTARVRSTGSFALTAYAHGCYASSAWTGPFRLFNPTLPPL